MFASSITVIAYFQCRPFLQYINSCLSLTSHTKIHRLTVGAQAYFFLVGVALLIFVANCFFLGVIFFAGNGNGGGSTISRGAGSKASLLLVKGSIRTNLIQ